MLFQIRAIASIERDELLFARNDEWITNVPTKPRLACQKRDNDRVPFRSFRLMRSDQLDRISLRRFSFTDLVEVAPKRERKVDQRLLPRFRGCRGAE